MPTGSIAEIVLAGRVFSRDEVWNALEQASIAEDINGMPMKLETVITEGAMGISGGQRQRLALARALIGQPQVLFLDEATSSLDPYTQAKISTTLNNMFVTRIVVAHRLSTIRSADQIAVLSQGTISELGTYEELSKDRGGYLSALDRA